MLPCCNAHIFLEIIDAADLFGLNDLLKPCFSCAQGSGEKTAVDCILTVSSNNCNPEYRCVITDNTGTTWNAGIGLSRAHGR